MWQQSRLKNQNYCLNRTQPKRKRAVDTTTENLATKKIKKKTDNTNKSPLIFPWQKSRPKNQNYHQNRKQPKRKRAVVNTT